MGTAKTLLTFEEFEQLPDQPGKRELLQGELIELPPAKLRHNRIADRLFLRLSAALEGAHSQGSAAELGEVCREMGYKLANDAYVQPDVSITHAGQAEDEYFGGAPAIAVEIISPSNTARQMELKTTLYFQFGAREVWRINPEDRYILVYLPGKWHVVAESESVATPLLPGLALPVAEILGK
jgi:Uma2 family endonuclease